MEPCDEIPPHAKPMDKTSQPEDLPESDQPKDINLEPKDVEMHQSGDTEEASQLETAAELKASQEKKEGAEKMNGAEPKKEDREVEIKAPEIVEEKKSAAARPKLE